MTFVLRLQMLACTGLAVLLGGSACAAPPRTVKPPRAKPAPPREKPNPVSLTRGFPPIESLTQIENGAGVLVGEPVPRHADDALTAFGAGCSRWLQLMVGGEPELGRTPLWTPVDYAWRKLRYGNRLTVEGASRLSQLLGVTHAMVGEIDGDPGHCTLTYRLVQVPSLKQLGEPFTLSGTRDQVVTGLPAAAARLARALGVRAPHLPETVGETADDLQLLGGIPWIPGPRINGPRLDALRDLAREALGQKAGRAHAHPPLLAAFLYMVNRGAMRDSDEVYAVSKPLAEAMPDNLLVLGEVARQYHWSTRWDRSRFPTALVAKQVKQYPHSYLARTADGYLHRMEQNFRAARLSASQAVRCSARNPEAWSMLENIVAEQADSIRYGRFLSGMAPSEVKACTILYRDELKVAQQTVKLDPTDGTGWRHVSRAAAFIGEGDLADEAFDKALELITPTDFQILSWGLEMYQPKWYGDKAKLRKVGELAVSLAPRLAPSERVSLALSAYGGGLPDVGDEIVRTDEERADLKRYLKRYLESEKKPGRR